jgi:hypothetical protein
MNNKYTQFIIEKFIKIVDYEERVKEIIYKILNIPDKPVNTYIFEFIKNGEIVNKTVSLNKHLINEDSYDFIILSNESTKHKKIIQCRSSSRHSQAFPLHWR